MPSIACESLVACPLERLGPAVLCMEGVNYELGPWVRMTAPAEWRDRGIDGLPLDRDLFDSVILLFGALPTDLHRFRLHSAGPDGFEERSRSLMNRHWHHDRRLIDTGDGRTRVVDKVDYRSRLPGMDRLLRPVYAAIFRHRHRRLRRRFGA